MLIAGTYETILAGPQVVLDGSKPALRECRYCGCKMGVQTGPSGPHANGVRCADCYRHLGWLASDKADFDVIE